ncbi:unnamed protein product [Lactuca virosa]|uniref:DNA (cytosine-5-)-methyltransferase n=1 Tax=Lactuca virosa TaxID=75947 RepID=A0AAU9N7Y2_9ASTR|nr:unnamed protein product [Lactuca virosa]
MDDISSSGGSHNIDWNTDDELEIANISSSSSSSSSMSTNRNVLSKFEFGESCSSSNHSSKLLEFIEMGFCEAIVTKVIAEIGENDSDSILDTLLTYSTLDEIPHHEHELSDPCLKPEIDLDTDFSDLDDNCSDEDINESVEKDDPLVCLIDMGYSCEEASAAITRCGRDVQLSELIDFITAAHISKEADEESDASAFGSCSRPKNKKKSRKEIFWMKRKNLEKKPKRKRNDEGEDEHVLHLPNPMTGFGIPYEPFHNIHRTIPDAAIGPPYFYFENVAFTPKGSWNEIKRNLYEIEPEFVDSKFFCAAARKRGYIHNLPLTNRSPIQPLPPRTLSEALPSTKQWWPSWDKREQLNCILTCRGSAKLTNRIKLALENSNSNPKGECECEPSEQVKKFVINQCKKWNMVWTGKTKVAPLEPDEIELIMGFPIYHTRGESTAERFKGLGNAFQVDTVAYHLSVLKKLYPNGMNVLSLFSGIGGAEVALHRLGIRMKNVVSVEKSVVCRKILRGWWEQTNQKENLIHVSDVKDVTVDKLEKWIGCFGGFDLVIGGSPCNNLSGGNRWTRDGLDGEILFAFLPLSSYT